MWYDLVVAAILLFTTLRGAIKGIVWQLAAIASLVGCFIFAQSGSLALSPMIPLDPPLNRWTAMFLIYVICSAVCFGTARMLKEGIERAKFVEYDRHLGAILGFVKGAVICVVMTFFAVTMAGSLRGTIMKTYSGHASAVLLDKLAPVLPDELHAVIDPYLQQWDDGTGESRFGHHDHEPAFDDQFPPSNTTSRPSNISDPFGDPFTRPEEIRRPADSYDTRRPAEPRDRLPPDDPFGDEPLPSRRPAPREDLNPPRDSAPFDPLPRSPRERRRTLDGNASDDDVMGDLTSRLASAADEELKRRVRDALRNTSDEDRAELVEKLGRSLPGLIRSVADEWKNGKPKEAAGTSERERLLNEISAVYSDFPDSQAKAREEFEESLRGVPDRIALAVIQDWHADLFSVNRDDDPDPSTGINTPLDARIVKQLTAARVPLSSLSESLQSRLRNAPRR